MKIPNVIKFWVKIKDGKFANNTALIGKLLEACEGREIQVIFKQKTNKRTNAQNNYYWGVIVPIFRNAMLEEWGELYSKEEVHEFLKFNCNYKEKVNEDTGEIIRVTISTTENTTISQNEFFIRCSNLCKEFFNRDIPPPTQGVSVSYDTV